MRIAKRALAVVSFLGFVAAVLRLRGRGGTPPTGDGWQEIDLPESA